MMSIINAEIQPFTSKRNVESSVWSSKQQKTFINI